MAVTLILPLTAPLGVGRIITVDEESGTVRIRDLTTGIVYRVPGSVLPELGALPWRGRVEACTVLATEEGVVTELVLDANPVGAERRGAADALRGAQRAADDARDQAANWGGTDRRAHEVPERFW
ncbi:MULTISPECIES: hypothetical protein [unclassified Microbacterium]|uniref:hypothetical protein n=1 Tax=unclassified Microbacterium TaxID=2609290 RepID=UPI001E519A21|nr:hypothetical protein [Microbacterium sp. Au-Mic1]MCE4024400.1 hypothetical protein [Microbacterium sp. Au-Mic1]